jgi:hypothetical protein
MLGNADYRKGILRHKPETSLQRFCELAQGAASVFGEWAQGLVCSFFTLSSESEWRGGTSARRFRNPARHKKRVGLFLVE